jgi:hypothetical protein
MRCDAAVLCMQSRRTSHLHTRVVVTRELVPSLVPVPAIRFHIISKNNIPTLHSHRKLDSATASRLDDSSRSEVRSPGTLSHTDHPPRRDSSTRSRVTIFHFGDIVAVHTCDVLLFPKYNTTASRPLIESKTRGVPSCTHIILGLE